MKPLAAFSLRPPGFTLVELMVSMGLISLVGLLLVSMTNSTISTWRYTEDRIEQFRSAETAFEAITRRLSQATLNTYWDYDHPTLPKRYLRQSELRFITGRMTGKPTDKPLLTTNAPRRPTHGVFFQAPLGFVDDPTNFSGLENLINTWGYYVEFNQDDRPAFIAAMPNGPPARYRYRLMELMQPSNRLNLYKLVAAGKPFYKQRDWFSPALDASPAPTHVLAENVIALALLPKLSAKEDPAGTQLAPKFAYDSAPSDPATHPIDSSGRKVQPAAEHQLPPIVQVTLVAIDETSAARLANGPALPPFDALLDTLFSDATKLDADLTKLQAALSIRKTGFRVFTSSVSIRGAKWSKQ